MSDDLATELAELGADLRAVVECWSEAGLDALPAASPEARSPPMSASPAPERKRMRAADPPAQKEPPPPPFQPTPGAPDFGNLPSGEAGLARVREVMGDCQRCGLCQGRRSLVFGVGDPEADLLICGEGPGEREDREGVPFVGPAGQMLDRMLENVLGLAREQVYILNVVKCRPPGNRTPLPEEIAACAPFLEAQIQAIQPKIILSLGRPATQTLLKTGRGIKAMRGQWQRLGDLPVMPTFHPAYLLRQARDKRLTFEDLKAVRQRYDELGGRR